MSVTERLDDQTIGTVRIGDREVPRLGFGTMRIASAKDADGNRGRGRQRSPGAEESPSMA